MNETLGLRLLASLLEWNDEATREYPWLKLMARYKYDGYQDFVAGKRFLESLISWLRQFETVTERRVAYRFVRERLVYLGPAEMNHLIRRAYPEVIRRRLVRELAGRLSIPEYLVWSVPGGENAYRRLLRASLFFGLSDGARIDVFRRANSGLISNEQVLLAPQIHGSKWKGVLKSLRQEQGEQARFEFVFLLDDFTASGRTLVRLDPEENEWTGKLVRFWEDVQPYLSSHFADSWSLGVHHYVASHDAAQHIRDREGDIRQARPGDQWFRAVDFTFGTELPCSLKLAPGRDDAFLDLVTRYYDSSIETTHTRVGGSSVALGFGDCALPLVLDHNTPNNSIALLWAESSGQGGKTPYATALSEAAAPCIAMTSPGPLRTAPDTNPFAQRATERLRDEEAFLEIVSPEPLSTFLAETGRSGQLYEMLAVIAGAPGSGKTTLARLFQFPTLITLLRNQSFASHRPLLTALMETGALLDEHPTVLAGRLPMESNYRDMWEFPYEEDLKIGLLTGLIQARAVLAWLRSLRAVGIEEAEVEFVPREDAAAAAESIGGTRGSGVGERAREVEAALYAIAGALVAPDVAVLPSAATGAYRPFDVIERIRVRMEMNGVPQQLDLRPLLILDDAHSLHPVQFAGVQRWLARRELRIARWMLTRLDILTPREVLQRLYARVEDESPALMGTRDVLPIALQGSVQNRREHRALFRTMAKDMAGRYLRRMPVFERRGLRRLEDLLSTEEPGLPESKVAELRRSVDATQRRLNITAGRRAALEGEIARYADSTKATRVTPDVALAMLNIMMQRYANRIPQDSLFGLERDPDDPEPSRPVQAKKEIVAGAKVHLLHRFDRPFYYGMDTLADASTENAEQFLQLARRLVDVSEVQITRNRQATLDAATQHRNLRERAEELLQQWSFPYFQRVQYLTTELAHRCTEVTLRPNAVLGAGANAYGIRQEEFDRIPQQYPDLARVLQFGLAYNALTLVANYDCKKETWCLLELGGLVIIRAGLTLQRGGFLEGGAEELARMLSAAEHHG